MKVTNRPCFRTEFSSHDIRAITARMAHPDDPLAEWRFEFEEWQKAYAEFQQVERDRFLSAEPPGPIALREHRYVLFLLMTQGEELGLALMHATEIKDTERSKLLDQVDAFLGSLSDSWHTWHGEALPAHRQALAKFLS
jgi:hypothetical protein